MLRMLLSSPYWLARGDRSRLRSPVDQDFPKYQQNAAGRWPSARKGDWNAAEAVETAYVHVISQFHWSVREEIRISDIAVLRDNISDGSSLQVLEGLQREKVFSFNNL